MATTLPANPAVDTRRLLDTGAELVRSGTAELEVLVVLPAVVAVGFDADGGGAVGDGCRLLGERLVAGGWTDVLVSGWVTGCDEMRVRPAEVLALPPVDSRLGTVTCTGAGAKAALGEVDVAEAAS